MNGVHAFGMVSKQSNNSNIETMATVTQADAPTARIFFVGSCGMVGLRSDAYKCVYIQCPRCNTVGIPVPFSVAVRSVTTVPFICATSACYQGPVNIKYW